MICMWSSWCHCHLIISCSSKIQSGQNVFPIWCRLTQVVLEKRPLKLCKKSPPYAHCHTTLLGYIFATKSCIDNQKKLVKQQYQYLLHMCSQYGELRPTNGWNRLASLRHPSKFKQFRILAAPTLLSRGQQTFAWCLAVSWAGTLYTLGTLVQSGILPGAKFTLRPSLAFSIGSITARHSSIEHQPNFAAWYKEWNYGTFA